MRELPATIGVTAAPSSPIRARSPPGAASDAAWYCIRGLRPRSPITITAVLIGSVPAARTEQRRAGAAADTRHWTGLDAAWTGRRPRRPEGSYAFRPAAWRRGRGVGGRARADHRRRAPSRHD